MAFSMSMAFPMSLVLHAVAAYQLGPAVHHCPHRAGVITAAETPFREQQTATPMSAHKPNRVAPESPGRLRLRRAWKTSPRGRCARSSEVGGVSWGGVADAS